jgi:hypothetical protein
VNANAIPRAVLRIALERAKALAAQNPDIVSVGFGFKYSRTKRYGAKTRMCIKLSVETKRDAHPDAGPIPRVLVVTHRGERYRIPTDVDELASIAQHAPPEVCAVAQNTRGTRGTPGFFLQSSEGRAYLVTAGHVLFNKQRRNPWGTDTVDAHVDNQDVGRVVIAQTYFFDFGNALVDVGLIELSSGRPFLESMNQPPWTTMTSHASERALEEHLVRGQGQPTQDMVLAQAFGLNNSPIVAVESLIQTTFPVSNLDLVYAPNLLSVRAVGDGAFSSGDSGGPLVLRGNKLLGIHVLGRDGAPPPGATRSDALGWSITAESIIARLEVRLGATLRVVPCRR